jgi:hypothetical protein
VQSAGPVSMDELTDYVRRRLPIKARLIGPERLRAIVEMAVSRWPADELSGCQRGSSQEEALLQTLSQQVGLSYQATRPGDNTYGFVWVFLLSAVLSGVVQAILRWWLEKEGNRHSMAAWKRGAA